jgi:hypothetical protein
MVKGPELSLPSSKHITGLCREAAETGAQSLTLPSLRSNLLLPYKSLECSLPFRHSQQNHK